MRRHGPVIAHCTDSEDFPSESSRERKFQGANWLGSEKAVNLTRVKPDDHPDLINSQSCKQLSELETQFNSIGMTNYRIGPHQITSDQI